MTHINLLYRLQRLRSDEQQVLSTGFGSAQTTGTKASVGAKSRQNRSLGARAAHQVGALVAFILVLSSCASAPPETPYNLGVEAYRKRDYSEAAAQWTKAVANDDTAAMNNLGYLLYNGYGVAKDIDRALKLWRVAAVAGESESQ
jgi:TPR repeat protein